MDWRIRFRGYFLLNFQTFSPRHLAATHPFDLLSFLNIVHMILKRQYHHNFIMTALHLLSQGDVVHMSPLVLPLSSLHRHQFSYLQVLHVKFTMTPLNVIPFFFLPTCLDHRRNFVRPHARTGSASARPSPSPIYNLKEK